MDDEKKRMVENAMVLLAPDVQEESITIARALCPFAETMPDHAIIVTLAYVELKGDLEAVEYATGFSRKAIKSVIRSALSQRIISRIARSTLAGSGVLLALNTLRDVAASEAASPAARVRAAEGLLQLADTEEARNNPNGKNNGGKDLNAMSLGELADLVSNMAGQIEVVQSKANALEIEAEDPQDL